jgi:hypothetical protein
MITFIISHKIAKIETGKYGGSECDFLFGPSRAEYTGSSQSPVNVYWQMLSDIQAGKPFKNLSMFKCR